MIFYYIILYYSILYTNCSQKLFLTYIFNIEFMAEKIFNELTRNENLARTDLLQSNAATFDSLVFDSSYQMLYAKGTEYFKLRVAPHNYSVNDPSAPFLNDTITTNNAKLIVGQNTTYAMYVNPKGEITIVDYNYYLANHS